MQTLNKMTRAGLANTYTFSESSSVVSTSSSSATTPPAQVLEERMCNVTIDYDVGLEKP